MWIPVFLCFAMRKRTLSMYLCTPSGSPYGLSFTHSASKLIRLESANDFSADKLKQKGIQSDSFFVLEIVCFFASNIYQFEFWLICEMGEAARFFTKSDKDIAKHLAPNIASSSVLPLVPTSTIIPAGASCWLNR